LIEGTGDEHGVLAGDDHAAAAHTSSETAAVRHGPVGR
jgi:hypothetical protein